MDWNGLFIRGLSGPPRVSVRRCEGCLPPPLPRSLRALRRWKRRDERILRRRLWARSRWAVRAVVESRENGGTSRMSNLRGETKGRSYLFYGGSDTYRVFVLLRTAEPPFPRQPLRGLPAPLHFRLFRYPDALLFFL